jgi:acyl transferase domain-containing protein/acyl carrier protein
MTEYNDNDTGKDMVDGLDIAVIGMSGRFPGARNTAEFLENLKAGVESISFFSHEELAEAGVDPDQLKSPDYVGAKGILEGVEYFDAQFFGYIPAEARIMSPQMRLFHECVWEALEDSGVRAADYDGLIGLYGGANSSLEWENLCILSGENQKADPLARVGSDRDYICSKTAYNLNLKGPTFSLHSACSTSLVAIHLACQALLSGECDIALAGGVSVTIPIKRGYVYTEGMIFSPDGHVRAFDAGANGTVESDGAGVVVLKRPENARKDRDNIYAVVKGTAVNNDGKRKIGFTAPSMEAVAEVIQTAHQLSGVSPHSISYVETHGTGTPLGDTIELEALKKAFDIDKKHHCAIGSVKTNLGHVDAAAGVTGFIKTVLSLKHKLLFPSLNYKKPNPGIDNNCPFYVNTQLTRWENSSHPLRACVNGMGIGGTNVHIVLEEAPEVFTESTSSPTRRYKLLLLSAKTPAALEKATENLAHYLQKNRDIDMADAAYTLQLGRQAFPYRRMLVCHNTDGAITCLSSLTPGKVRTALAKKNDRPIIFMFPGQGSQYVNMGLEIYRTEAVFREEVDRCFELLKPLTPYNFRAILYPGLDSAGEWGEKPDIHRTEVAQILVFVFQNALVRFLINLGITPHAMIGYSLGEYTAACTAGVLSLEDALTLVAVRCKLICQLPAGAMLSVPLPKNQVTSLLAPGISLAIDNGASCVVSGPRDEIALFEQQLKQKKCFCVPVEAGYAIHSKMMAPILTEFVEHVSRVRLNAPVIPYVSNVTGQFAAPETVTHPGYWARHLGETVRFAEGLSQLLREENALFLEVGPGKNLSTLVSQHKDKKEGHTVINLVKHPLEKLPDDAYLLNRIGQLWLNGVTPAWDAFYTGEKRYRIPLPTYPFDRTKLWIEGDPFQMGRKMMTLSPPLERKEDMADWFYVSVWEQSILDNPLIPEQLEPLNWLVFMDNSGLGSRLVEQLEQNRQNVIIVRAGTGFTRENERSYNIAPGSPGNCHTLFLTLQQLNRIPNRVLHLWGVENNEATPGEECEIASSQELGLYSLLNIARAVGTHAITADLRLLVVTSNIQSVTGEENIRPIKATALAAVKIIPQEYINISCRSIDIIVPEPGSPKEDRLIENLLTEISSDTTGHIIAYRGSHRWKQVVKPLRLEPSPHALQRIKSKGVYMITGGLGGIGLTLAEHLAGNFNAHLILIGHSHFPPRQEWDLWLKNHDQQDRTSYRIRKIRELEDRGAEIMVYCGDVSDETQMHEAAALAKKRFGRIQGLIHSAGIADFDGIIQQRTREMIEKIMASKVKGTLVLDHILKNENLDFIVLFSSLATVVYQTQFGQVGYIAANEFLDAYANYKTSRDSTFTVTVNWTDWLEVGMSVDSINRKNEENAAPLTPSTNVLEALLPSEGAAVFNRILENNLHRVNICTKDLNLILERSGNGSDLPLAEPGETPGTEYEDQLYQRPELSSEYVSPGNDIQEKLALLWQRFFGIKKLGIDDDFFELGGDSLKAMYLAAHIHKVFGVIIPLKTFFDSPTIEGLAQFILNSPKGGFFVIEPVEKKEYYPVSSAQKRIYIMCQINKENNTSYNQLIVYLIRGEPDIALLERGLRELINRHESLRTSFDMIDGKIVQEVHDEVEFALSYFDAPRTPQGEVNREELEKMALDFVRPFDLAVPPLFRAGIIKIEKGQNILVLDIHHMISDGVSISLIINQLKQLYAGLEPEPVNTSYKDFARWQNNALVSEKLKTMETFWLKQFEPPFTPLHLPTDFQRPEVRSLKGDQLVFSLPGESVPRIKQVLLETQTTMFMLLLTVFTILLSIYTGKEDITVGSPTAGRGHESLQYIVGMFVNMIPMRNHPRKNKSFNDFLREVKENAINAFENQDYQYDILVGKLGLESNMRRHPLVKTVFTLQNVEMEELENHGAELMGITFEPYNSNIMTSSFDLTLDGYAGKNHVNMWLTYSTDLFKADTIKKIKKHYIEILVQVINDLNIKLEDIKISHDLAAAKSKYLRQEEGDFGF